MVTCGSDREKTTAAVRKFVLEVLQLKYAVYGIRNMLIINCACHDIL